MAVTVTWIEFNESNGSPGSHVGSTATNINFGNTDAVNLSPASYPIAAASNSFAKYLKVNISGSYTQISNAKLYKSAGNYVTGESILFSGSVDWAIPVTTDTSDPAIATSLPESNNICLPNLTTDTLPASTEEASSPGYYSGSRTSLMRFQVQTTSSTPAGAVNQKTFSITYDRQ